MKPPKYYRDFSGVLSFCYDFFLKITTLGYEDEIRAKIFKFFPKKSKKILDMACGTGSHTVLIKERYPKVEVFGADLSQSMLKIAKKKAKKKGLSIKFSRQNIEKTNFKANTFDVVTISFGLHEVPLEVRPGIIKEAYRVLKKKGRFIVFDLGKPRNPVLRFLFYIFNKIFEEYIDSFLEQDLGKELKKRSFKKIQGITSLNGLIQIIKGEK